MQHSTLHAFIGGLVAAVLACLCPVARAVTPPPTSPWTVYVTKTFDTVHSSVEAALQDYLERLVMRDTDGNILCTRFHYNTAVGLPYNAPGSYFDAKFDAGAMTTPCVGPTDVLHEWAVATPDRKGWFRITAHGNPRGVEVLVGDKKELLGTKKLAALIRRSGWTPGTPILLQACSTGAGADNIAVRLANELSTPVSASEAYVWRYPPTNGEAPSPVPSHLGNGASPSLRKLLSPGYRTFFPGTPR